MREELLSWMATYPTEPSWRDGTFAGAPSAAIVSKSVPEAVKGAINSASNYVILGSAGKGDWTHTPWVAVLDPAETSTVEEGIYVVYLLSKGCERLYLTLNQGCTTLKDQAGIPSARAELLRRAAIMRSRLNSKRLKESQIDLNTNVWRADLYEHGTVLCATYTQTGMPSDDDLKLDLEEALRLYRAVLNEGGWEADDQIVSEAASELGTVELLQAKMYRRHRQIERNPSHSKMVKRLQGTICKGCGKDPRETYGEIADALVDAHHLRPLSSLADGEVVSFDPMKDFAVLCPNCHRVIHRLDDAGDLAALRALVAAEH
jgi:5-methylcytosine-specific restriction enzyme A